MAQSTLISATLDEVIKIMAVDHDMVKIMSKTEILDLLKIRS